MRRRFVQIDGQLQEVPRDWCPDPKADHHVMPDIKGYRSMIDGSWVGSRSTHRAHLRQHGCVEIGNDSSLHGEIKPLSSPPGLKDAYIRAVNDKIEQQRRR